jgi:transposase
VAWPKRYSTATAPGQRGGIYRNNLVLEERASSVQSLGPTGCLGDSFQGLGGRCRQRIRHDRQYDRAHPSTQCGRQKKDGEHQAIGRSKGGLSTKINAVVDALGNPIGFCLTPGSACDRYGSDELLTSFKAETLLADQGYDADERVIHPLRKAGKAMVIPPKRNRKEPRPYDQELYKARHLIEHFFAKFK